MMDLRGFERFSLVDYPGKIACILFTGGCNLRCPFCHNPVLVFDPHSQPRVTEREFFNFLAKRHGLLEGVVISGGEPMLHSELPDFIRRIREDGFLVKLDTNGSFPDRLEHLLKTVGVDALGIDYKAPAAGYARLTGLDDGELAARVHRSIVLALAADVDLDIRTTVHRELLSESDLAAMHTELTALGVTRWMLQQYNPVEVISDTLSAQPTYSDRELVNIARRLGPEVHVRGLNGHILGA